MKLIRFGNPGNEKPGVVINNKRYDVSQLVRDFDEDFFAGNGIDTLKAALDKNPSLPEVAEDIRWASPVSKPSKIICIGLNYADHAAESNMAPPAEPVVFFKSTTALVGPNDDVMIPATA